MDTLPSSPSNGPVRDIPKQRALFSLPPIQAAAPRLPAIASLPQPACVTGDAEIDCILWLRAMIATGEAALIDKALETVKWIKAPLKTLEARATRITCGLPPPGESVLGTHCHRFCRSQRAGPGCPQTRSATR